MQTKVLLEVLRDLSALGAGVVIGLLFGAVQNLAARRYQKLQGNGALNTAWAVIPGSMRRVAGLLVALALVQVFCPLWFVHGSQWWISGGVMAGYGALLFRRLRRQGAPCA
jgi:hypothetical protein